MADSLLSGSFRILFLYDVGEEIRIEELRKILGAGQYGDGHERRRDPAFGHPSPEYVRFERPPLVQHLGMMSFEPSAFFQPGARFSGEVNYYQYGVVSLKLEVPFELDWPQLCELSSKWIAAPQLEAEALRTVRGCLEKLGPALVKPNREWLSEDYYIIHLHNLPDKDGARLRFRAPELIAEHSNDIARIVRGEVAELSEEEKREILASQVSYYPEDLLVVGWTAAFLCDTPEGAIPTVQLLEYANTQLLEFRYYDSVLTQVLERVYAALEQRGGLVARWRLAREAENLNKIRLEVRELTERIDTSIKFLSDMFSDRQYRMLATKIGVDDYRRLVESKLHTAADLYTFMMDQFNASRGFVLELMVVVILVIDLIFVFRGNL
jgi:hypothetical protein